MGCLFIVSSEALSRQDFMGPLKHSRARGRSCSRRWVIFKSSFRVVSLYGLGVSRSSRLDTGKTFAQDLVS